MPPILSDDSIPYYACSYSDSTNTLLQLKNMFGAVHRSGPLSYAKNMLANNKVTYMHLPAEESSCDTLLLDQGRGFRTNLVSRLVSALAFCSRVLVLLLAVYAAVTLALRRSNCNAPPTLTTNSFLPACK